MVADLSRRVTGWWILLGPCEPGEAANVPGNAQGQGLQ